VGQDDLPHLLEAAGAGWRVWGVSLKGSRDENQDRIAALERADLPRTPVLLLADGAGGMFAGGDAAELAMAGARAAVEAGERRPAEVVWAGNRAVQQRGAGLMATTLVVAWRDGDATLGAHAGDSRAYAASASGAWRPLTRDHNAAEEAVRAGRLAPEAVSRDPRRHLLTRAVGSLEPSAGPEEWRDSPAPPRLLLCCDGFWSSAPSSSWEGLLVASSLDQVVSAAEPAAALGTDNVSVLLCAWQEGGTTGSNGGDIKSRRR
jgi:protein phosphatase